MLRKESNLKKKISVLFEKLNIKRNNNILLHSNTAGILQFANFKKNKEKYYKLFINLLLQKIGSKGTLVLPTYNFDFTKGKAFYYDKPNSQVGELGNFFLKKYKATRSLDPVFSYAIMGNLKDKLLNSAINVCFGEDSIFNKIEKYNFKFFGFCCPLNTMSYIHFIERKMNVKYRYNKTFKSKIITKRKKFEMRLEYFVGKKNIDYKVKHHILEKAFSNLKHFYTSDFGNFYCWSIRSKDCLNTIQKKIKKRNNFLIK